MLHPTGCVDVQSIGAAIDARRLHAQQMAQIGAD
jgi:hypothetical protein